MFEIETAYDDRIFIEFQKLINSTIRAPRLRITRILFFVVGVISMLLLVMWLMAGAIVPAIASGLMALVFFAAAIFFQMYISIGQRHNINRSIRSITYYFNAKAFNAEDGKGRKESDYSDIKYILEGDTCFAIMIEKRQGFVLDKSGFKKGSPAEFAPFIEEKTGLTIMKSDNN